jgi:hypothetical protein
MSKSSNRARLLATKLLTVAVVGVLVTLAGLSSSEVVPAHGYKKYHYHYCGYKCQKKRYAKQRQRYITKCKGHCGTTTSTCTFCAKKDMQQALQMCNAQKSQVRGSCLTQGDKVLRKQCLKAAGSTFKQCKRTAAAPLRLCKTDRKKCSSCCRPNYSEYGICQGYFSDTATYGSYKYHNRYSHRTKTYCVHDGYTGSPSGAFLGGLWERSLQRLSSLFPSLSGAAGFVHQDGCAAGG